MTLKKICTRNPPALVKILKSTPSHGRAYMGGGHIHGVIHTLGKSGLICVCVGGGMREGLTGGEIRVLHSSKVCNK